MTDAGTDDSAALQPVYIVMGVTGSGKTTIGTLLAERLDLPFYDADDFHTKPSLKKLANDEPLSDEDREPWLDKLSENISKWAKNNGAVLACSALKHSYRSRFRRAAATTHFIYLTGDPKLIAERLVQRANWGGHVVKDFEHILRGQYRDLEIPTSAIQINIEKTPSEIVDRIVEVIRERDLHARS